MQKKITKGEVVLPSGGYRAMILAAGLGTRLGPLTENKPKALVDWKGVPLIAQVIRKLKNSGFTEIIINVHHQAEKIMEYVESMGHFGIRIEFSHEKDELLDTGGGIAHAAWFFDDRPFLVYNVDILSTIDLIALMNAHRHSGAIATLAVKERVTSRSLLISRSGKLKGWRDNRTGEMILADGTQAGLVPIAFSAIHVMDPKIFKLFPTVKRFPIMPFYLELARTEFINTFRHNSDEWMDMGKLESYSNC
jgi:NDP-sugar pyrophosphorylase family protein